MKAVRDDDDRPARAEGFSANIEGVSLADLVQMESLAGGRRVVRVTSGEEIAYLYFKDGSIVHAVSPSNTGEEAVLEILGWTSGCFEPSATAFTETESVNAPVQALLLRAAQARDELKRHNLFRFPRPTPPSRDSGFPPESRRVASATSGAARSECAVRLDASGDITLASGTAAEDLAGAAAFATRLGRLVGEALGLDPFYGLEAMGSAQRIWIDVESDEQVVALRAPPDGDLAALRLRAGM